MSIAEQMNELMRKLPFIDAELEININNIKDCLVGGDPWQVEECKEQIEILKQEKAAISNRLSQLSRSGHVDCIHLNI